MAYIMIPSNSLFSLPIHFVWWPQIINKLILVLWFLPKFDIPIYQRTSYMMNVAHAHTD